MRNNKRESLDGFIPRRPVDAAAPRTTGLQRDHATAGLTPSSEQATDATTVRPQANTGLQRAAIDQALGAIDEPVSSKKHSRRVRGQQQTAHKHLRRRKIIKRVILSLVIIVGVILGYIGIKAFLASNNIFQGDLLGLVSSDPLQEDANGRSNILVFGTSEDDEGHEAPYLTDSLMVISLNQHDNTAAMFSIPRDLWVDYDTACVAGYQGRINALYECYANNGTDEPAGANALRAKIGEVTGLDIQYYVHVNYSVVRDSVAAVGGVTIEIEGDGADGIMDSNFDWKCGATRSERIANCPPNGHFIEYPNGPAELDAEHALYLAMARGANGNAYGLDRANFDREANQRKIAIALKEKALSAGTLTDFTKVSALLDAFGSNLRTNFKTSEIRTLMRLGQDITEENIQSISLVDATPALFANENIGGASVLTATSGRYNYSAIANYLAKQLSSDAAVQEGAVIVVYNGGSVSGAAQQLVDELAAAGLNAVVGGNAPTGVYNSHEIYMVDSSMTATQTKLEEKFSVTAATDTPPISTGQADIIVIIGD